MVGVRLRHTFDVRFKSLGCKGRGVRVHIPESY